MPPLTISTICAYSKNSDLTKIKNFKCWGRQISDISIFNSNPCPNLKVLNLSINKIEDISPLQNLNQLEELYLRHNSIKNANFDQFIEIIKKMEALKVLWVDETLMEEQSRKRKIVENLPSLLRLNGFPVSREEKCSKDESQTGESITLIQPTSPEKSVVSTDSAILKSPELKNNSNSLDSVSLSPSTQNLLPASRTETSPVLKRKSIPSIEVPSETNLIKMNENHDENQNLVHQNNSSADNSKENLLTNLKTNQNSPYSNILTASLALLPSLSAEELELLRSGIDQQLMQLNLSRDEIIV